MTIKDKVTKEVTDWLNHHIQNNIEYVPHKSIPVIGGEARNHVMSYESKLAHAVINSFYAQKLIDVGTQKQFKVKFEGLRANAYVIKFNQVGLDRKIESILTV